jgi:hypothetical protein
MGLFDLGLGPVADVVGKALDKFFPDANKAAEAKLEVEKALIANQAMIFGSMKEVMAADAASEGWMTRNARPMTVYWCLGMMTWVVVAPIFGLQAQTIASIKAIPMELWNLSAYGIGAYILGKSGVDIAKAIKK